MATEQGIIATKEFGQIIGNMSAEDHDQVLHILQFRTQMFCVLYEQDGPVEFVKAFYEIFDETIEDTMRVQASCKKGCHFCCRQNVEVSEAEVAVIVEFLKEHGINISRNYLMEQLKYGRKEVSRTEVGWRTFLKDGECSIYPVRPLACRSYHVVSVPELCDTVKYPPPENRVIRAIWTVPELEVSAFYGAMKEKCKTGRLPALLLPHSK